MNLIVDFLRWVWQRGRPDNAGGAIGATDGDDRSSMADFVRILQTHDQDTGRPG